MKKLIMIVVVSILFIGCTQPTLTGTDINSYKKNLSILIENSTSTREEIEIGGNKVITYFIDKELISCTLIPMKKCMKYVLKNPKKYKVCLKGAEGLSNKCAADGLLKKYQALEGLTLQQIFNKL